MYRGPGSPGTAGSPRWWRWPPRRCLPCCSSSLAGCAPGTPWTSTAGRTAAAIPLTCPGSGSRWPWSRSRCCCGCSAGLRGAAALPLAIGVSSLVIAWFHRPRAERRLAELWPWLTRLIRGKGVKPVTDHLEPGCDGVRALGHSLPRLAQDEAARKAEAARRVASVRTAGDALAAAAVAVPGLGLVRSFTGPAFLAGGWYAVASWVLVALGFAFATLTWPAANGPTRALLRRLAGPSPASGAGEASEAGARGRAPTRRARRARPARRVPDGGR